ncbi:hypothetical protein D3C79_847940 [compost metagenome]
MLGVPEGLGVDADQKAQGRPRAHGRQFADQHLERIGAAGQVQVAHAQRALGEVAEAGVGLAVFERAGAAHHPEADAPVFFAEQVELVGDLQPVLAGVVAGQR